MNNKLILGLGAMAAAAFYFLRGKKEALENIQVTPLDIAINSQKTNLLQLVFNLKLKIANPGNFKVNINNINLDVIVNNKKISEFEKSGSTSIEPKNAKTFNIEIIVKNLAVVDVVLNTIADGSDINIHLLGNVRTDLGTAIIDYKKKIDV
jgi:LEA14-like dessication related protein